MLVSRTQAVVDSLAVTGVLARWQATACLMSGVGCLFDSAGFVWP